MGVPNIPYRQVSLMLLSHLYEYACKWAYEYNSAPIRNDRKKIVEVCKHSLDLVKIRNMLLKFASIFATYSLAILSYSY